MCSWVEKSREGLAFRRARLSCSCVDSLVTSGSPGRFDLCQCLPGGQDPPCSFWDSFWECLCIVGEGVQCSWYQHQICFGILFSSMCRMCPTQRNWAGHTTEYIMYNSYAVLLTCRKCSLIRRQLCAFVIKLSHLFTSNVDFGNIPFKYNIIRGITICIWNKYDLLCIKECFTGKI